MKIYIYNKKLELISIPYITNVEDFKENPQKFYPEFNNDENLYSEILINNPVYDNWKLREKTREELIFEGMTELLEDGEIIEDNKIIKKEIPTDIVKPSWSKEKKEWLEIATPEEVKNELDKLINEYITLAEEKEKREKYKFSTIEIDEKIEKNTKKRKLLETKIENN